MTLYPKHQHQSKGEKPTKAGKDRVPWFLAEVIVPSLGTQPNKTKQDKSVSDIHLKVKNTEAIKIHVFCHIDESFITFKYWEK